MMKQDTAEHFFISSAGGTGNTYLLNTLLGAVRSNWCLEVEEDYDEPSIGMITASTVTTPNLLKLGQTFHLMLEAPCTDCNAESCFPLSAGSELARVIIATIFCLGWSFHGSHAPYDWS
jgi:hypothetical protein